LTRSFLLTAMGIALLGEAPANNGVSFVANGYYFDLSYGDRIEFFDEKYVPGSTIWKLHFKSILRIELPPAGGLYRGFTVPDLTPSATIAMNRSKTLVLATFGEYAIVLTPQFHLLRAYRNTTEARWLSDEDIVATVEIGGPVSKYDTGEFALNVHTDQVRRLR
jgi:hypothetical protein